MIELDMNITKIPQFTKKNLKQGYFVHNNEDGWGIIVNDTIQYFNHTWDKLIDLNDNLQFTYCYIDKVCEANCLADILLSKNCVKILFERL